MQINTDGLVILEKNIGESDRLITILTREEGVLRAFAQKANRLKSAKLSATQLLSYSRFSIYKGRDKYIIDDAVPHEIFFGLRNRVEALSLAQYFCELAGAIAPQGGEAGDFLRLILNALHFLSKETRPLPLLKAVVEMRILSLAGYMPDLIACAQCAAYESDPMYFLPQSGKLLCADCFHPADEPALPLHPGILTGLRHTIYADFEKLFSFRLPPEGLTELEQAAEAYLVSTLERRFQTLDFYHQVKE